MSTQKRILSAEVVMNIKGSYSKYKKNCYLTTNSQDASSIVWCWLKGVIIGTT